MTSKAHEPLPFGAAFDVRPLVRPARPQGSVRPEWPFGAAGTVSTMAMAADHNTVGGHQPLLTSPPWGAQAGDETYLATIKGKRESEVCESWRFC